MSILFRILGYLLCIVPASIAVLEHFPLWLSQAEGRLSLISILLLAIAVLPFWRAIRERLRTPSAWMVWLMLFLFLSAFRPIIDGLIAISLVAFPASILGALCLVAARRLKRSEGE